MVDGNLDQIWFIRLEARDRILALKKKVLAGDWEFDTLKKIKKVLGSDLISVIEGEVLS